MKSIGICAVVFIAIAAHADDGAITGVGGAIHLMNEHPRIALVAEHVTAAINASDEDVEVECLFVLENMGAADTVQVGFPEFYSGYPSAVPFEYFQSTIDGVEVPCERVEGQPGSGGNTEYWWTRNLAFAAYETRVVCDRYRAPAGVNVGDAQSGYRMFDYVLYTWSFKNFEPGKTGPSSITVLWRAPNR